MQRAHASVILTFISNLVPVCDRQLAGRIVEQNRQCIIRYSASGIFNYKIIIRFLPDRLIGGAGHLHTSAACCIRGRVLQNREAGKQQSRLVRADPVMNFFLHFTRKNNSLAAAHRPHDFADRIHTLRNRKFFLVPEPPAQIHVRNSREVIGHGGHVFRDLYDLLQISSAFNGAGLLFKAPRNAADRIHLPHDKTPQPFQRFIFFFGEKNAVPACFFDAKVAVTQFCLQPLVLLFKRGDSSKESLAFFRGGLGSFLTFALRLFFEFYVLFFCLLFQFLLPVFKIRGQLRADFVCLSLQL